MHILALSNILIFAHLILYSLYSHINQKTQFENPVMEAKRKLSVDTPIAAPPQAATPSGNCTYNARAAGILKWFIHKEGLRTNCQILSVLYRKLSVWRKMGTFFENPVIRSWSFSNICNEEQLYCLTTAFQPVAFIKINIKIQSLPLLNTRLKSFIVDT